MMTAGVFFIDPGIFPRPFVNFQAGGAAQGYFEVVIE